MAVWRSLVALASIALAVVVDATGGGGGGGSGAPLVDSKSLRQRIEVDALRAKAKALQTIAYSSPTNNRLIGTEGHNATINWIRDTIAKYPHYYTIQLQPLTLSVAVSANLTINGKQYEVYGVTLAPSGTVTGPLVHIPNLGCEPSDFPANLNGSIILVFRGTCQSAVKVALAASRGAIGAIVYNNVPGNLDGYALQRLSTPEGPYVPTGGISQADGEALTAQIDAGTKLTATLSTVMKDVVTYNVIAQTKGGDQNNVIHLGGHSDSVAAGPGINDNGSGTISLLEIAIQLTHFSVKNAVRFSWWTAEEEGLLGATYYVSKLKQSELDKIRLFLDFDMMASPNYAIQIYDGDGSAFNMTGPPGSAEAEKAFIDYFANIAHLNYTSIEFDGRSDYGPFLDAGVAAGGISGGAEGIKTQEEELMFGGAAGVPYDVNYHEDGDNFNNLSYECWIELTRAIAHMTAKYARSFDSLPPKHVVRKARREASREMQSKRVQRMVGKLRGV